jgi:D-alanyl-D-alanine-carboxypeptidase/D-alanyl-D-alanine-endopeptidase
MVLRQSLTCVIAALLATTVLDGQATGSRQAQIQSRLEERVAAGNAVGLVAASLEPDGTVVIAAAGKPGPDALPLDGDSVFEIGSITKVFTSVLLADMVERGEVTLDTPVQKLLPAAVRMPRRNGREITLIDLATHSSGLPRLPNNMAPSNPLDPYSDYGAERLYAFLNSYELTRDIGATFEYSNLGAGLLGHALERRAGKPYKTLVTERILRPLGMTRTSFTPDDWMKAHLARGHDAAGRPVPGWDVAILAGAGGLRSTANDMMRFARANLAAPNGPLGRVLARTYERRHGAGRPDLSIGLGWIIRRAGDRDVLWHNGGTGGYRAWLGLDFRAKRAVVVLANSQHGPDDLGNALLITS